MAAAKRVLDLDDVDTPKNATTRVDSELVKNELPSVLKPEWEIKGEFELVNDFPIAVTDLPVTTITAQSSPAKSISAQSSPAKSLAVFSPTARANKIKEAAEFRLKTSKQIQAIDQLWPRERKAQVWDEHRRAKNDLDQAALNMKDCDLCFKMAVLRVTELRSILEQRKLLDAAFNETVIID